METLYNDMDDIWGGPAIGAEDAIRPGVNGIEKCERCRAAKQKCDFIRPSQTCDRCAKLGRPCGPKRKPSDDKDDRTAHAEDRQFEKDIVRLFRERRRRGQSREELIALADPDGPIAPFKPQPIPIEAPIPPTEPGSYFTHTETDGHYDELEADFYFQSGNDMLVPSTHTPSMPTNPGSTFPSTVPHFSSGPQPLFPSLPSLSNEPPPLTVSSDNVTQSQPVYYYQEGSYLYQDLNPDFH